MAAREVLGHRRCAGWLGGDGGCGTSVGEGTARGGKEKVVKHKTPKKEKEISITTNNM